MSPAQSTVAVQGSTCSLELAGRAEDPSLSHLRTGLLFLDRETSAVELGIGGNAASGQDREQRRESVLRQVDRQFGGQEAGHSTNAGPP
ncbi:hypothetical protein JX265_001697 [Neoarthrinium moseri]|uniref:Uncharacterized protein n=1 Tax=Neoarthrinium moseri TaxID=1658444 RepID=A0A9P9WVZ5_9PEZI|nr:uncharacterized protein JN550_005278 [Neoarthrinium moseri]KAI1842984.1 hypothetical protein JX266_010837 [Neoarthrinium moseri]KAI1870350.1 hypothetical protein JN550_005278 [Neoarthrinium moseri]KAI1880076.1 hypothetical protein JX265_001697 [Neoarthrinium moseri]